MIDLDILEECGTTNERLRQLFTAEIPSTRRAAKMDPAELKEIEKDVECRKKFERKIADWLNEHVVYGLSNHRMYSAVDLAWDSSPITKQQIPLLQYAQGRIDPAKAQAAVADMPGGGADYLKKDDKGKPIGVDLPKLTSMEINLVRSVVTRRAAAQSSRYNLWPHFNYEPRDMTQVGRLRGDLTSQRMDVMADAFGYKHFDEQVARDMMLYPNGCIAFPRCSWEREVQWAKSSIDPSMAAGADGKIRKKAVVTKEGISWTNPHPSRVFYDNNYPLSSLNTDTGCEYVGFWDVTRWGDIADNPDYFNRKRVTFSADTAAWFTQYAMYFNQYFDRIVPPSMPQSTGDPAAGNDRKNNVGLYTGEMTGHSAFLTNLWVKIIPREWRIGTYPYPVWVHLKAAGDSTVVYGDIMPSSPAAVFQYNCHDGRLMNISIAHELMQFQDQLTNLYSQLLETIKADLFSVAVLNTDVFPDDEAGKKVLAEFENIMAGKNWYASMQVLKCSFEKLSQLLGGKEVTADMVFTVVRSKPNTQITSLFEAITRVISMADRLFVMSPHEQGQAAPHEITASESNQIATSTDTIYDYISKGLDKGRSAMKRICFESTIACGQEQVELPVVNRYSDAVIAKAGFTVKEQDEEDPIGYAVLMGHKNGLLHDYIFTSRDGGERKSNPQSAQVLVQLLQAIGSMHPAMQNAILSAMGKEKLFEFINTIGRLTDAGVDFKLQLKPGEDDGLLVEDDQQVMQMIQQMGQALKQNTADVQKMKMAGAQLAQKVASVHAPEKVSLSYKDLPEDVKRQAEASAGFRPSMMPALPEAVKAG